MTQRDNRIAERALDGLSAAVRLHENATLRKRFAVVAAAATISAGAHTSHTKHFSAFDAALLAPAALVLARSPLDAYRERREDTAKDEKSNHAAMLPLTNYVIANAAGKAIGQTLYYTIGAVAGTYLLK